jgi:hypothetical protein
MDFVEKPAPGTEPSNNINAGTYVMEPGVLERTPTNTVVSIERETFPQLAAVLVGILSNTPGSITYVPALILFEGSVPGAGFSTKSITCPVSEVEMTP